MAPDDETLNQIAHLISTLLQNKSGGPHRRLAMCFDATYLVSAHQLLQTQRGSILAGGAHRPAGFCDEDESAYVIERTAESQEIQMKNRPTATQMLSFLVWDCTRPSSPTLEFWCVSNIDQSFKTSQVRSADAQGYKEAQDIRNVGKGGCNASRQPHDPLCPV